MLCSVEYSACVSGSAPGPLWGLPSPRFPLLFPLNKFLATSLNTPRYYHQRFRLLRQMYPCVVRLSVCLSDTLVHYTKAVGRNEMRAPFGGDTGVIPSNTVLDRGPGPHGKGTFGGRNPQFAAMPPIAKLYWPLF